MPEGNLNAIKGGEAYVRAFLDDNPVTRGLAALQRKFGEWQENLSRMAQKTWGGELPEPFAAIARFAVSPAGVFGGLLEVAHHTAETREELLRMSETTGVAVEKLSELQYAASRAGVGSEALASGLRKLQSKEFSEMLKGGNLAGQLGVTAGMDAADQIRAISKAFEGLDDASRIGLAKQLGITELLPLLDQGVEKMDALTARARQLGLTTSREDVEAAKLFTSAWGDLKDVLKNAAETLGGALVPGITFFTNAVVNGVVAVRDWLKEHESLTRIVFYSAGAIVAGGLALKEFSTILGYAKSAIGMVSGVFGLLSGAVGVVGSVLGFVLSPIGLVVGAILALGGYLLYTSGYLEEFGNWAKRVFSVVADEVSSAFKTIGEAMKAGDMAGAFKVAVALLRLEWTRFSGFLMDKWGDFKQFFADAGSGIYLIFLEACAKIQTAWYEMVGYLEKTFARLTTSKVFQGVFEDVMRVALAAKGITGEAADMAVGVARAAFGVARQGLPEQDKAIDEETKRKTDAIEKQRKADADAIGANMAAQHAAREKEARDREAEVEKARKALKEAQDKAHGAALDDIKQPEARRAFEAAQAGISQGTFSGAAAGMIGGLTVEQQQLFELQDIARQVGSIAASATALTPQQIAAGLAASLAIP
jgi:hypothetical protein